MFQNHSKLLDEKNKIKKMKGYPKILKEYKEYKVKSSTNTWVNFRT
jgi:hypothetical protein